VGTLLIAPGEGAAELLVSIAELGDSVSLAAADPVAGGDDAAGIATALSAYEAQGRRLEPEAAIVHGSGDRSLAAVISLVKLGIPVARLTAPAATASGDDLPGLLSDHTIPHDEAVAEEVRDWLRRILTT
jgi:hypothetical protein